jgi:hypothetical protein
MDSNQVSRRKFFKGAGLVGAFATGLMAPVVIREVKETQIVNASIPTVDPEIVSKIEKTPASTLSLMRTYGEVKPPEPHCPDSPYVMCIGPNQNQFVPGTEKHVDVKMVPGPDGELYLNINGSWKRVLTT